MAVDGGKRGRAKRISFAIETQAPVRAAAATPAIPPSPAPARPHRPAANTARAITLDPRLLAPAFLAVALGAAISVYLGGTSPLGPIQALAKLTASESPVVTPVAPDLSAETEAATALAEAAALPADTAPDAPAAPDATDAPASDDAANDTASAPADESGTEATAAWMQNPLATVEDEATAALPTDRMVTIGRGDTLMDVLRAGGVPADEAYAAISALRPVYDPRRLQIGQQLALSFGPLGTEPERFLGFKLDAAVDRVVTVGRDESGFLADVTEKPLTTDLVRAEAPISSSLYMAGANLGVPPTILIQLFQLFSYDVDFQRDIQPGDAFSVMFENQYDESGKAVQQGDIIYAALTSQGHTIRYYRYKPGNGDVDYFNEKGESARKALLRTPVDGARLSSGFGMREHPVLGYSRMHKGVDFAVPSGTPIYAAGNGTVDVAGVNGGYGRYVRIRHNNDYSTAYAHMSRFGAGIHSGVRVRQGQIIGYVGSTGLATGPHLHYEVLRDGTQINPMGLKLQTGQKLARGELAKFQAARAEIDRRFAGLAPNTHIAERGGVGQDDADGEDTACATAAKTAATHTRGDGC